MKKFVISSLLVISSASAFATDSFCETKEMLKKGGYGAAAGAVASLLIPGAGPVFATSLFTGTLVTTTNVGICAFDEADRKSKLDAFNKSNSDKPTEKVVVVPVEDRGTIVDKAVSTSAFAYAKISEETAKFYNNLTK